MEWISAVGYRMFPLSDSGYAGAFQDVMHMAVTALVVLLAMTGACLSGGVAGVAVPSLLRRVGADPATASSIFLTTTTDIVGISLFLGLATAILI